jgi:predicted amidohydrolase YtcJ
MLFYNDPAAASRTTTHQSTKNSSRLDLCGAESPKATPEDGIVQHGHLG